MNSQSKNIQNSKIKGSIIFLIISATLAIAFYNQRHLDLFAHLAAITGIILFSYSIMRVRNDLKEGISITVLIYVINIFPLALMLELALFGEPICIHTSSHDRRCCNNLRLLASALEMYEYKNNVKLRKRDINQKILNSIKSFEKLTESHLKCPATMEPYRLEECKGDSMVKFVCNKHGTLDNFKMDPKPRLSPYEQFIFISTMKISSVLCLIFSILCFI